MARTTATIASGASLSGAVSVGGPDFRVSLLRIVMPADWTAASLTFQASDTIDGTFQDLYDAGGTEVAVTAAADHDIRIDPTHFQGVGYLKVRSGTAGVPVNQAAARSVTLVYGRVA